QSRVVGDGLERIEQIAGDGAVGEAAGGQAQLGAPGHDEGATSDRVEAGLVAAEIDRVARSAGARLPHQARQPARVVVGRVERVIAPDWERVEVYRRRRPHDEHSLAVSRGRDRGGAAVESAVADEVD